ncbi:MAG: DUF222 domain-containing protein [Acidimicrobiales bacterium]|nr:DUF222 domain-containing protein [Acidimicrobiales bacterium]
MDAAVDSLAASVDSLAVTGIDDQRAAAVLVELRRVAARLAAAQARLTDGVDTARPWAEGGYRSTANWLATSDHTSMETARAEVRLARRLRTMPATRRALEAGDITAAHAHKLAALNGPQTAAPFAEAEEFLVGQARTMRWVDFVKACAHWLRLARDEDPDPDERDRDHRHVDLHDGLRGTGLLQGELTPVAKAEVRAALERIERELFEADWAAVRAKHGDAATVADIARTPRQRRHDALVEMASRAVTAPADGKRPRPLVTVLVGYDAFEDMCELADGTLISPATGAGLLDEAVIERIVFDADGRVLDLGQQRSFVGAARRAVEVVDRRCTGPGCDVPDHRCDVDHIWRHSDGGPTRPDNGQLRCGPHNRQRQHPPPLRRRPPVPVGDPEAHLELLRRRIRDRLHHDPTWITPTQV